MAIENKSIRSLFLKMNTDLSQIKQDNKSFFDAVDLKLITDEVLSNGALVNFKGTKARLLLDEHGSVNATNTVKLKGYSYIDDTIVLFLYNDSNGYSIIAKADVLEDIPTDSFGDEIIPEINILYSDEHSKTKLNFGGVDYIGTVSRKESDYSEKVYFSVKGEPLRFINLKDKYIGQDASVFDIIPNHKSGNIEIEDITEGGNLQAGKIQYCYRLFKKYGAETTFSTTTDLISLTSSSPNGYSEFTGSDLEDKVNKSIKLTINNVDKDFDYINIYSIFYSEKGLATINLVGELPIYTSTINFIDSGNIIDVLTLEEFNNFGGRLFSANDIESKNNTLFAAGIEELQPTIDIDCRAYRFKGGISSESGVYKSKIFQKNGGYYEIEANGYFTATNIVGASPGSDWNIPKEADCINYYNDEFLQEADDYSDTHPYQYDRTSTGNLGGTGKIVSYEIAIEDDDIDLVEDGYKTIINSNNEDFIIKQSSHKQGEVYRYGVTFYDLKGKPYFVNWIGDIRMPYFSKNGSYPFGFKERYTGTEVNKTISVKNLSIRFKVDLSSIDSETLNSISGFRISRVERTEADKSILCQGHTWLAALAKKEYTNNSDQFMHKSYPMTLIPTERIGFGYPSRGEIETLYNTAKDKRKDYIHFLYSPELFYNNGINLYSGDIRLKIVNIYDKFNKAFLANNGIIMNNYAFEDYPTSSTHIASAIQFPVDIAFSKDSIYPTEVNSSKIGNSFSVLHSSKLNRTEKNSGILPFSTADFLNYSEDEASINLINRVLPYSGNRTNGDLMTMYGPTSAVFISKAPIAKLTDSTTSYVLDIYVDNANSRYGGNSYYDRLRNTYIPTGKFIQVTPGIPYYSKIINCDSYNTIFDTLTSLHDPKISDATDEYYGSASNHVYRQQVCSLLPVESSINCALSNLKPSKYVLNIPYITGKNLDPGRSVGLQETTSQGVALYGESYPSSFKDLNSYNTVYSTKALYPTVEARPLIFDEELYKGNEVIASELKVSGEIVDSWSKFLYANTLDVEAEHGDIQKLEKFKNKLLYFQENGYGQLAVNERYVISNENAGQLSLGSGGILERFDYIKYNEGIVDPRHIINSGKSIYFLDNNRKVLDDISTGDSALSIQHGINSLIRSLYQDENTHVAFGFDPKYKEVLFTIDNKTLVFNENINVFAPRISNVPKLWLNTDNKLLSYIEDENVSIDSRWLFLHNVGERGEKYSEAYLNDKSTSEVTFIVNPNAGISCIFDYIKFNTEVYAEGDNMNTGSDLLDDTINSIVCRNTYQNEVKDLVVDSQVIRQSGEFDFSVNTSRRARYWTTQIPIDSNGNKFVDNTLMITLKYNNNNNKLFKLQDIITYFRPSNR